MSHEHGKALGATAGIVGCDIIAMLADINLGTIATGISMIGGSAVGVMYLWITQRAEAKAKEHKIWLEAHSNDIERKQAQLERALDDATADREKLTHLVAELTQRLDERDRTIMEFRGDNDAMRLEMQEFLRQQMREDGFIMQTTTKVMTPPSSDMIPAVKLDSDPAPSPSEPAP